MIDRNYLLTQLNQHKLSKLINYSINEFFVEFVFYDDKNQKRIYKHSLLLSLDDLEKRFYVAEEFFGFLVGRTINDEYSEIFSIRNGTLNIVSNVEDDVDEYYRSTFNQSNGNITLNSIFIRMLAVVTSKKGEHFDLGQIEDLLNLFVFSVSLNVYLLTEDRHEPRTIDPSTLFKILKKVKDDDIQFIRNLQLLESGDEYEDLVRKEDLTKYKKEIKNQEAFIRIFKPELLRLDLDEKKDDKVYHCRKVFDYGSDKKVDIEYESSGIKHLLKLHEYFQGYLRGQIVFIDEMDVNINSVYLCKLIEFLLGEGAGQLCFTSHNLETMNILKNSKASICAIGYERNIDVWAKTGNKSPVKEYSKGEFDHSPFNVEPFDFYSAFDVTKDN